MTNKKINNKEKYPELKYRLEMTLLNDSSSQMCDSPNCPNNAILISEASKPGWFKNVNFKHCLEHNYPTKEWQFLFEKNLKTVLNEQFGIPEKNDSPEPKLKWTRLKNKSELEKYIYSRIQNGMKQQAKLDPGSTEYLTITLKSTEDYHILDCLRTMEEFEIQALEKTIAESELPTEIISSANEWDNEKWDSDDDWDAEDDFSDDYHPDENEYSEEDDNEADVVEHAYTTTLKPITSKKLPHCSYPDCKQDAKYIIEVKQLHGFRITFRRCLTHTYGMDNWHQEVDKRLDEWNQELKENQDNVNS